MMLHGVQPGPLLFEQTPQIVYGLFAGMLVANLMMLVLGYLAVRPAVAVVPSVVRIGFGLGARRGKGILVVRQDDGSWSNPAFITLTGGSFGFQAGVQRTDVVLVFKSRRGVDNIANGKLTLGADAVMMASRFMATKECEIHDNIKQELVNRQEQDTALICKSIHLQGRALRNETVECVLETEAKGGGLEEIIPLISGERVQKAWETGDVSAAPMMVGQSIGLIHSVPTCAELLKDMMEEAGIKYGVLTNE